MRYATWQPIKYVGFYRLGGKSFGCCIMLGNKPSWVHRKLMALCLGFVWFDTEET